MSDDVLKRCPFCGNPPVILTTREDDSFERCAEVRCDTCGIALGDEYRADAIQLWNTRATLTASRSYSDEIEALRPFAAIAEGEVFERFSAEHPILLICGPDGKRLAFMAADHFRRANRVSALSKVKDQV